MKLIVLCALFGLVSPIAIDNGVEGDPELECGPNAITANFNTRNNFEGNVFVKGLFNQTECKAQGKGQKVAFLTLPFSSCNVRRLRSLNPRGVFVTATVVISFHQQFLTKVDRAYVIQCFYMEADKTVSQDIEVSDLTTGATPYTQNVPMPVCRYDILDGTPTGNPIQYTIVGQQVYHKWTCDTATTDSFCMIVNNCFVDDGKGDRVNVIDATGCAVDRYLLRNLEYMTDLMAGQEAHVFKYADRAQVFFQCQIAISIKEPGTACVRPVCAEPARGRRSPREDSREEFAGVIDVSAQIDSYDAEEQSAFPALSTSGHPDQPTQDQRSTFLTSEERAASGKNFCLSGVGFGLLIALLSCVIITTAVIVAVLCLRSKDSKVELS